MLLEQARLQGDKLEGSKKGVSGPLLGVIATSSILNEDIILLIQLHPFLEESGDQTNWRFVEEVLNQKKFEFLRWSVVSSEQ